MKKLIILGIILTHSFLAMGQRVSRLDMERASKFFNNYEYAAAAKIYERMVAKDSSYNLAKLQLAESYRLMNQPSKARLLYADVIGDRSVVNAEHYLHFAQTLMSNEEYDEALTVLYKSIELDSTDSRALRWINGIINYESFFLDPERYTIDTLNFNSDKKDYAPAFYQDGLVFSSSRDGFSLVKQKHGWDDANFQELFYVSLEDSLPKVSRFDNVINTRFHEGPMVFYDNDEKLIFTRNNFNGGKPLKAEDETIHLQLYLAERTNSSAEWQKPTSFPFNSREYSTGHPALSEDETTLFFASDRPNGYGGVDLYSTTFDGTIWSDPKNLGPEINTEGDEMFPFLRNGVLYFASNGHYGLGGLDLFEVRLGSSKTTVKNMGAPLNSPLDDFGLILEENDSLGFFTSNRANGIGEDDIYSITIHRPKPPVTMDIVAVVYDERTNERLENTSIQISSIDTTYTLQSDVNGSVQTIVNLNDGYTFIAEKEYWTSAQDSIDTSLPEVPDTVFLPLRELLVVTGELTDPETGEPVNNALLTFTEPTTGEVSQVTTTEEGILYFIAQPNSEYDVFLEKEGYFNFRSKVSTGEDPGGVIQFDLEMDPIIIGRAIRIENIYFDLNKDNIRPDAAIELNKIVQMMEDNPTIVIELGSHTDSRGSDPYNLDLSDRRAKSSANYIISRGISGDRIIGKGYGETQLVNQCRNGIKCFPEEHQANRRTEFKVIGY